jgi:hypothetical protein
MVLQKILRDYILYLQKLFNLFLLTIVLQSNCIGQKVTKSFSKDSIQAYLVQDTLFLNKIFQLKNKEAILIALQYYPELIHTNIKFKVKKSKSPLAVRPKIWAIFQKPIKRKYIITISNSTTIMLKPILFENLTFNSQIGVIGHELAHISFYQSKQGFYLIKLAFMHLNKRYIDKIENNTDKSCIDHGLGHQILLWSKEVRQKLNIKQWGGANTPDAKKERYMNPESIINYISLLPIYNE